ncbi:MAG: hypothetical protein HYZ14_01485 [Bacteroidetes bacterium]|nr:hypothetical protein [Bacteroidota bacterium]
MIQYEKLYQSLKKISAEWHAGHVEWQYCWDYIKFFADGTFIQASILGDSFDKINTSFNKESANVTHGTFVLEKGRNINLNFGATQINGAINNDGSIIINGRLAWDLYTPIG